MVTFWNIVLAVVIGITLYSICYGITSELIKNYEFNKEARENSDKTHITLHVPYDKLDEEKLNMNTIDNLHLNKDTNEYVIQLKPVVGKVPMSEVKKIVDEYHATSYQIEYIV